jgi:hypothetical protein
LISGLTKESELLDNVQTSGFIGERWKSVTYGPGGNTVPGKCIKCHAEFLGPPNDRLGQDSTKTWFRNCRTCHRTYRHETTQSVDTRRKQHVDNNILEDEPSIDTDVETVLSEKVFVDEVADLQLNPTSCRQTESISNRGSSMINQNTASRKVGGKMNFDDETIERKEGFDDHWTNHNLPTSSYEGKKVDQNQERMGSQAIVRQDVRPYRSLKSNMSQGVDHQERQKILDELRSLNEEQMATMNIITLTNESMTSLIERQVKTSYMVETLMKQLKDSDTNLTSTNK